MSNLLDSLVGRVAEDPFFLAAALGLYAQSEALDDAGLCRFLACPVEALPLVRLCRLPAVEMPAFQQDVDRIAQRFGLHADALAEAVRRGQALLRLRQGGPSRSGTLLAARESEAEKEP
jgi:hypothetical protein